VDRSPVAHGCGIEVTAWQMRIGLISDTHGLLRPEALRALQSSDRIVHAGDIGDASILQALQAIAPVTAVRGNNDRGQWATDLPPCATLGAGECVVGVVHELADAAGFGRVTLHALVFGHSHRPSIAWRSDGTLLVNPGSAGPRRFSLPVTVAEIVVRGTELSPRVIELDVPKPARRG
jgi:putative phosphoesterase